MLDILEVARDKGIQEGKILGIQETIIDDLTDKFTVVPRHILKQIRNIQDVDALKGVRNKAKKCLSIYEFEEALTLI